MSRRDVEAHESLGSFKVSASVSEAAKSRLGLGSEGLVHILGFLRLPSVRVMYVSFVFQSTVYCCSRTRR